jgi:tetratricopeptide (TPR) repeat protein
MAESNPSSVPRVTADQRRAAAGQFERANQVLTGGDLDYGLQLLSNCCKLDPSNRIYRKALRQSQKSKYHNNQRGQPLAAVRAMPGRWKLRKAMLQKHYLLALVYAEQVLMRNPWDFHTHLMMAKAFEELDQVDLAIWTLEQLRPLYPKDPNVNRPLARLYEKRGIFTQAIALWEIVRKEVPTDLEAQHKVKDLAASETIAKGRYEEAIEGNAPKPRVQNVVETKTDEHVVGKDTQSAMPALPEASGRLTVTKETAALLARIQADPTNANAHLQLAGYYRRLEEWDQARAVLKQALAPTGNHFEVTMELLDLDIEPFRRDLAITEEKLRQQPKSADLQRIRAELVKEVNARELDYFRRRSDRYPTDAGSRFEMSIRLLRAAQIDEAIKELQTLRNDPRFHGKVLFYLGFCFKSRKNWRLAQRNFEDALPQLSTGDPALHKEALYQLATGCAEAGDLARAVDVACELINLDFGYKNISELLDTWQAKVS